MSVVWASGGGNEWGSSTDWGRPCRPYQQHVDRREKPPIESRPPPFSTDGCPSSIPRMRMVTPTQDANKEGYSGTPTSFIDLNDPRLAKLNDMHKRNGQEEFKKNIPLVEQLIKSGVVYPTKGMLEKAVGELKRIARG